MKVRNIAALAVVLLALTMPNVATAGVAVIPVTPAPPSWMQELPRVIEAKYRPRDFKWARSNDYIAVLGTKVNETKASLTLWRYDGKQLAGAVNALPFREIKGIEVSPFGDYFVTHRKDSSGIEVWNADGEIIHHVTIILTHPAARHEMAFHPGHVYMITRQAGKHPHISDHAVHPAF